ncbi:MAG: septum formation initiator family protein, partial [Frankia sp.]
MMTRRTRLTTRVALLGLVVVALALTLVYPLRLYLAQRGQINKMAAANQAQEQRVEALRKAATKYHDPNWVRDQARLRLHYAAPG